MTWIAAAQQERREQIGRFLLGTGGIGGIAGATGLGLGLSDSEGLALIDRAVKEGFKILDTADMYTRGNSERVVGTWNRAHPGARIFIQTKTGITPDGPDLSPDRVARQLEHSIAVLGRVDLYVAHQVDPNTPWAESLPVFSRAVENGTIRAYGLSNVDGEALASALETADRLGLLRPELVQNQYSLLARGDDKDVLPLVQSEGLAYTPFSPLANGLLAGRYSNGERPAPGSRASVASRSAHLLDDPATVAKLREFDRIAETQGVTPAGLALGWLLNHPVVTAPIVSVSKESQWQGIHDALTLKWTGTVGELLDEVFGR
ncbi:MAG TPA: aldo/keto reductase [Streptosporangiaceae bacterium]|jgi:1-deoxyxylulose-5-phosphate synthase|nr:aldo/keto reductase [Streptosporangiaceae bacterium]